MVTTTDNGSCGTPWATDTVKRTFYVKKNHDGSYRLLRRDRGTFVTTGPRARARARRRARTAPSCTPARRAACTGTSSATSPAARSTRTRPAPADCGFTDVFITTFFGPNAQYSCFTDSKNCRFDFEYSAPAQGLKYHHWSDKGHGAGSMLQERFRGDIADH